MGRRVLQGKACLGLVRWGTSCNLVRQTTLLSPHPVLDSVSWRKTSETRRGTCNHLWVHSPSLVGARTVTVVLGSWTAARIGCRKAEEEAGSRDKGTVGDPSARPPASGHLRRAVPRERLPKPTHRAGLHDGEQG